MAKSNQLEGAALLSGVERCRRDVSSGEPWFVDVLSGRGSPREGDLHTEVPVESLPDECE